MVLKEYENIHALLNAWESSDGEAVPGDHEDLLLFLIKDCLLDQFESIATLQKLSLCLCHLHTMRGLLNVYSEWNHTWKV